MTISHNQELVEQVIASLAVILAVGAGLAHLAGRVRQPRVIGEIAAGIVLGPSLLGLLPGDLTTVLFPLEARPFLSMIAQLGLLLFMFNVGWEFDTKQVADRRHMVAAVAVGAMALPFVLGTAAGIPLYVRHATVDGQVVPLWVFVLFVGIAMSITALPVLARIVEERGLQDHRIGVLALASAAACDVVAWTALAVLAAFVGGRDGWNGLRTAGFTILFLLAMRHLLRPLLRRLLVRRVTLDGAAAATLLVAAICVCAFATSRIGIHPVFGAFAFGMIMPRDCRPEVAEAIRGPVAHAGSLLLPIFFVLAGLSVDVTVLGGEGMVELLVLCLLACSGKIIGAGLPARLSGMSWRGACDVGLLMNTRGLTELVVLDIGRSLGILDQRIFTVLVLMALITTAMTGPLLGIARAPSPAEGRIPEQGGHRRPYRSAATVWRSATTARPATPLTDR